MQLNQIPLDNSAQFMMIRKVPSFAGLRPASEVSSRTKRNNRRSDTQHEVLLRRELSRMGLRFRKNVEALPGKPDIVFSTRQVVVFCDGDFWHGRNWKTLRLKLDRGTNANYWSEKIASNIKRDRRNTALLEKAGWRVIRLWEKDIKRDPTAAAKLIRRVVDNRHGKLAGKIGPNRNGRMKR
jgi:DNA mismatch endonuclease (patch repair protein)